MDKVNLACPLLRRGALVSETSLRKNTGQGTVGIKHTVPWEPKLCRQNYYHSTKLLSVSSVTATNTTHWNMCMTRNYNRRILQLLCIGYGDSIDI